MHTFDIDPDDYTDTDINPDAFYTGDGDYTGNPGDYTNGPDDDYMGDPRRCPVHGCPTSSPDGLFDAPCGECEAEIEEEADYIDQITRDCGELVDVDLSLAIWHAARKAERTQRAPDPAVVAYRLGHPVFAPEEVYTHVAAASVADDDIPF